VRSSARQRRVRCGASAERCHDEEVPLHVRHYRRSNRPAAVAIVTTAKVMSTPVTGRHRIAAAIPAPTPDATGVAHPEPRKPDAADRSLSTN
jgi:hypothetical protein